MGSHLQGREPGARGRHAVMRRVRAALARIIGLGTRQADDERMGEEMALHLERLANRYIKEGFSPEEARRRAAIEFGGYARQAEAARDARRARWLEDAARDLRHGWRALVRKPAFGATAV